MMNEATLGKSSSKEEKKFNKLWQGIQQLKETMLIQNEKQDKLTNITQNLENKLNGIQKKKVEYENKLNRLEEKKNNYALRWFRKQIYLSSNLTDKNNT